MYFLVKFEKLNISSYVLKTELDIDPARPSCYSSTSLNGLNKDKTAIDSSK